MNTEVYTWRPLTEFEHEELGMRLSCTESFPDLPTDMMVETENGLEVSHFAADFFFQQLIINLVTPEYYSK